MSGALLHMTGLAALAVFGVLLAGIWNMGRPDGGANLSQKLMRWRVGLQFLAVVIAMLALAITQR